MKMPYQRLGIVGVVAALGVGAGFLMLDQDSDVDGSARTVSTAGVDLPALGENESTSGQADTATSRELPNNTGVTSAGGGEATPTTLPSVVTSPPPDGRPWADNTGPSDVSALRVVDTVRIEEAGTVLENVDVRGHIDIRASNVTVRNFRVNAGGANYGLQVRPDLSNVVIEDGEVTNSDSAGVYCQSACTLRRLHIHDHDSDGMKLSGTNDPSLVEYSFITRLGLAEGSHADGNQSVSGSDLTFRHNNFYMPYPGTEAHDAMPLPNGATKFRSNATFIIHDEMSNILIEKNWLNGGNYTIYGNRGTTVRDNVFGPDYRFGICNGPFDDWSGNIMEDGTPFGDNRSCP